MHIRRRIVAVSTAAVLVLATAAVGCGPPYYEHARVHGKVTYKGKPVTLGQVLFVPTHSTPEGEILPASGSISPDGLYELQSQEEPGAVVGEHKVVVTSVDGGPAEAEPDLARIEVTGPSPIAKKSARRFKMLVPEKYALPETTPLTRTVAPGDNAIDIELVD